MLIRILRFMFGYVMVEISGFAPERFMNLLIQNEIVIWDVTQTPAGYCFYTGRKNLQKCRPYLKKTNVKLHIKRRYGFPFLWKQYRKRTVFFGGFVLCGTVLYILSLFVWEVRVEGEDRLVKQSVLKTIETTYVPLGCLKSKVSCAKLEDALRQEFDEIAWISCELKGTRLTVYLEEGIAPEQSEEEQSPCDLVALKDGVIVKMVTRQGTPIVKTKQTVKKGDILVSGAVYIYDDNHEVLETDYVHAEADVIAQTVMQYEDYVDLEYYEKQYTEKEKNYLTFYFMEYCFTPYRPALRDDSVDTYVQIHKLRILPDFYLPIGCKVVHNRMYTLQKREYSIQQAKVVLQARFEKKKRLFQEKGVEITENNVTIVKNGGKMVAKGKLVLQESITSMKPVRIQKLDGAEQNAEQNGE